MQAFRERHSGFNVQQLFPVFIYSFHEHPVTLSMCACTCPSVCVCVCVKADVGVHEYLCICMWQSEINLGVIFRLYLPPGFGLFCFGFVSKQSPSGLELTQLSKLTDHQVPRI